jgi:acyl-CoA thioesterase FadM
MTVEYFARTGFLRTVLKNKWFPILGGAIITYRRELKLGQKYRLRYHWTGYDTYSNYLYFEFRSLDGTLRAVGYSKGAVASRRGLVASDRSFAAMGMARPVSALPEAVQHWIESEKQLVA